MAGEFLQPSVIFNSLFVHICIRSYIHSYSSLAEPLHEFIESFSIFFWDIGVCNYWIRL